MRKTHAIAMLLGSSGVLIAALAGKGQERLDLAGRGDSIRLALLRDPAVQSELKITDQQRERIGRLEAEAKATKKQFETTHPKAEKGKPKAKVDGLEAEAERAARQARDSELDGLGRQTDERLAELLNTRQRTRLTQIVLRVEGPHAFLRPEVIEKLGLQPDQLDAIREILGGIKGQADEYKQVQKRAFELAKAGGEFDLEKARKEQQKGQTRGFAYKLGKQAMPEIGRILTRHQRALFNQMLGDPFDLTSLTGRDGQPLIDESADLKSWLLRQPAIQRELALTPAQKEQLAAGTPASRVLDSTQKSRLGQLELQAEGVAVLTRPEVIRALNLAPEQLEQIQGSLDGLVEETKRLRDALKAVPRDPADDVDEAAAKEQAKARLRESTAELRGDVLRRIAGVLTRRQNDQLRKMLGQPFDFSQVRPAPPAR